VGNENDKKLKFENVHVDADQILNELGRVADGEFNDPLPLDGLPNYDDMPFDDQVYILIFSLPIQKIPPDFDQLPLERDSKEKEIDFASIEEKLARLGFGQSLTTILPE
jgi:hypothetical protein